MKLPALADPTEAADCEIRQLTSDLFHELSQPLTNLCCSLELALLQSPTAKEYRQIVSRALVQAEKASELATAIRELLDASHPGEKAGVFDLSQAVGDAVGDVMLVAEAAGVEIAYVAPPLCPVWFDAHRLRQGLFHLLGSLISMGSPGSVLKIKLDDCGPQTGLCLNLSGMADSNGESDRQSGRQSDQELLQRLELGIARTIFEAAGGSFSLERRTQSFTVNVLLPRKAMEQHEPQRTQRYTKENQGLEPS
ncbi:MAG: sensor histidine kinase [Candidatus Sulfotelmatobacter sp.]